MRRPRIIAGSFFAGIVLAGIMAAQPSQGVIALPSFVVVPPSAPLGSTFTGDVQYYSGVPNQPNRGCSNDVDYIVSDPDGLLVAQGTIPRNIYQPVLQTFTFRFVVGSPNPIGIYRIEGVCDGFRASGQFEVTTAAPPPPPPQPAVITLTPPEGTAPAGSTQTLTAAVSRAGAPIANVGVRFDVVAGPCAGASAQLPTDLNGRAVYPFVCSATGISTVSAQAAVDIVNGQPVVISDRAVRGWTVPLTRYVGLGDSYSSGEGAIDASGNASLDQDTDLDGANECHRSENAYAKRITGDLGYPQFTFRACSGAIAADMIGVIGGPGQWNDGAQLDAIAPAGGSSLNTGLVTLSIGGNDLGFADSLGSCVTGFGVNPAPFHSDSGCLKTTQRLATQGLQLMVVGGVIRIDRRDGSWEVCQGQCKTDNKNFVVKSVPRLANIFAEIHDRAPNAKIRVLLYPHLFSNSIGRDCIVGQFVARAVTHSYVIHPDAISLFNSLTDQLDNMIMGQVRIARNTGMDIDWADPRPVYEGHGIRCIGNEAESSSTPWINGLTIDGTVLTPVSAKPSPFSFHPNAIGQQQFATLIRSKI